MSLILDALKRSRSEESAVPGVDTYHAPVEQTPVWRVYLPWAGLGVAVLVVAWLLLERFGVIPVASPQPVEGEAPGRATPAVVQRPLPPAPAPRVQRDPAPVADDRATAGVREAAQPMRPAAAPVPAAPVAVEQEGADPAVADLYRARDAQLQSGGVAGKSPTPAAPQRAEADSGRQATRELEEQPLDLEDMLQQARTELESGEFVDHPAPFITSLSQQARDPIPTILYQRHEYSGQSSRASVVMNGKTLRVGGSPAAGVQLEEILPNSSVLSYRGTQFRLRALNSWVNL